MRTFLLSLLLALAACSPAYDVCGPSTCDGCCTEDGACVAGTEVAACGFGGDWCSSCSAVGAECIFNLCRTATATKDAGTKPPVYDGGTPDAGPMVKVQFIYQRVEIDAGTCPNTYERITCMAGWKVIAESRLPALKSSYAACEQQAFGVSPAHDAGYFRFWCKNCEGQYEPTQCPQPDSVPVCTWPEFSVSDFCAWVLP